MAKFINYHIGNVVRAPNDLLGIVSKIHRDNITIIYLGYSNSSTIVPKETQHYRVPCHCSVETRGYVDSECSYCHGTGLKPIDIKGWDHIEFIADNVKDYIVNSLLKGFKL